MADWTGRVKRVKLRTGGTRTARRLKLHRNKWLFRKMTNWSFYALPRVFLRIICVLIVNIGVDFVRLVKRVAVGERRGSSNVKP